MHPRTKPLKRGKSTPPKTNPNKRSPLGSTSKLLTTKRSISTNTRTKTTNNQLNRKIPAPTRPSFIPPQSLSTATKTRLNNTYNRYFSSQNPSTPQGDDGEGLTLIAGLQKTHSINPMDATVNSDPGYIGSKKHPNAKHLVSPHLRKFVNEETQTTPVAPTKKAPILPQNLAPGYRYLLKHLKYVKDPKRKDSLKALFRCDFELLMKCASIPEAEVAFDRSIPNLWSQLSVVRMGISKLRRPRIPESLGPIAEYLGIQEGYGFFTAIRSDDSRFKVNTDDAAKSPIITESRGEKMLEKAKLYNMDLHPADIQRHYDLVERYHFNGKERRGN